MKKVRFPMYYEVVAYQEIELPDYIDAEDGDDVRRFIEENWYNIPIPDETPDYVDGTCNFDWEAPIEICDDETGEAVRFL